MLPRGDWEPGDFPRNIILIIKVVLFGSMMVRGADYFFGDSGDTSLRLTVVESAAPIRVWGIMCVVGSLSGFLGMYFARSNLILWGHLSGTALYLSFAVGVSIDVYSKAEDPDIALLPTLALIVVALAVLLEVIYVSGGESTQRIVFAAFIFSLALAISTIGMDGLRGGILLATIASLHFLMALGTAARQRQQKILNERAET